MSETLYCSYCGAVLTEANIVYNTDGSIKYYRCSPYPEGCGRIVRNPIVGTLRQQEES